AGVRRISLAGSLYRAAMGGLVAAAHELKDRGTFGYVDTALPSAELVGFMRGEAGCTLLPKMAAADQVIEEAVNCSDALDQCPLAGGKADIDWTSLTSAFDPKQTFYGHLRAGRPPAKVP